MRIVRLLAMIVMMILCMSLAVMPANARSIVVPGDLDGDMIVSADEMDTAERSYQSVSTTQDQLDEIRHIHENYPRTTTDYRGTEVTIYKPIRRIVSIAGLSAIDILRALGVEDSVIGVCKNVPDQPEYFPELSKATDVGGVPPDIEAILELDPDLILAYGGTCGQQADIEESFEDTNVTVMRYRVTGLAFPGEEVTMEQLIKNLGHILERDDEAALFFEFIQDNVDEIKGRTSDIPEEEKPRVYIGISSSHYKTCGNGSTVTPLCELAGGINIAANISGTWPDVDPEWVVEQNPDIIIRIVSPSQIPSGYETDDPSEMRAMREEIMNLPELSNVNAVKNGRVYMLSYRISSSGPSMIVGCAYMAKWFHPDLFEDLGPQAIHQEYLTRFQRLDYDLDEHGVFIYPPLEVS